MPQLDFYIAMSQVFWFTLAFLLFYLLISKNILPAIARSIKLREKKVSNASMSGLDDEANTVMENTSSILEGSLKDSQTLLSSVSSTSSNWLNSTLKDTNEKVLLDANKSYVKVIGELRGRSFLIEEAIRQK
jgi:F0F1-type ATP synthase membrane subunit b/b'